MDMDKYWIWINMDKYWIWINMTKDTENLYIESYNTLLRNLKRPT